MKFLKLLLSLHSLQLIIVSVLAIAYLVMATANSSTKTEAVKGESTAIVSEELKISGFENAESLEAKMEAASQPVQNHEGR